MRYYVSFSAWRKFDHEIIMELVSKVEDGKNILVFGPCPEANNRMLHILDRYVAETRDSVTMEDIETEGDLDIMEDYIKSMQLLMSTQYKTVVNEICKKHNVELIEVKEDF